MSFDELFDNSKLPVVLKQAKTLSKEECRSIYEYMKKNTPKTMLEFGVQYGCSTRVFLEISKWLGLDLDLHSWDIVDAIQSKCVNRKQFTFHRRNVTGKEEKVIAQFNPDLIFLDAHPYKMTKSMMECCLKHKVNFMAHDVSIKIYEALGRRSNNFKKKNTYGAWELYVLVELFGKSLLENDSYEDDKVKISFNRDEWGLAVVEVK